jgi:ABC-2 type transport system permease protein
MIFAAVLGKELRVTFGSPLAYVVTSVFLVLSGFFFYTNLVFFVTMLGFDLARGLWQYQFHDMQRVLMLVAPLLTMRLFAEERRQGTLELLWTYPIRDASVVLGKYASTLVLLGTMLLLTLSYPLVLSAIYPVDPGPLLAGYLGLFLLGSAFLACGLFVSALTSSQVVAGAVTFGLLLLFWALTWNQAAASEGMLSVLGQLSLFDRFELFARGGIESKDVVFFGVVIAFFLFLTELALESRRWRGLP